MALHVTRIHRIGQKPVPVMGCDRELVMFTGLCAFALAFVAMTWVTTIFSIVLWFGGLFVLRRFQKSDPLMRWVYMRQWGYAKYYRPRATPFRINPAGQGVRYK